MGAMTPVIEVVVDHQMWLKMVKPMSSISSQNGEKFRNPSVAKMELITTATDLV